MPLPKRQKLPTKGGVSREGPKKDDSRFANFQTDPKFQLPSKKHTKTKLDSRFSRLLNDPDFYNKATVDKYGRKIDKDAGKKELQRFYHQDEDEDEDEEDEDDVVGRKDKSIRKELAKVDKRGANYDPLRDGGFSESSSDESSSDDDDEEEPEIEEETELAGHGNEVAMGDVTARLAAVNMDWDNIRASDIMAVTSSFVPAGGRILNVTIYPSEFGLERIQREEMEGPPREIFVSSSGKSKDNITSIDELDEGDESLDEEQIKRELLEEGGAEDFDSKALRTYQLDRLRYYYAVITCSSDSAAKAIYDNLDGREYLTSANFFDLRFVPDDTTFDQDPHDESTDVEEGYKPNEFVTDALSHSKVKLTWDAEDTTRKEAQKRAFSRKEIDENELKAYLGSDSESEAGDSNKVDKAAALRAKLGLGAPGETRSKSSKASAKRDRDFEKPEGEMEVTFSAGLSANAPSGSVFLNEPESTLEAYVRKQKERKAKRKERAKAIKEGRDPDTIDNADEAPLAEDGEEEDPFNDPFFDLGSEAAKKAEISQRKAERAKKREEREKAEKEDAAKRAELELLMVDDKDTLLRHFDMNDIIKSEKAAKKSKKKKKNTKMDGGVAATEDTFALNVEDPRFAKLYDSHEFAIDPTNPRFKETKGMKALLEEGRKKRKRDKREDDAGEEAVEKKSKGKETGMEVDDLKKLAARVKAKIKKMKME
ncbi:hypothetical protein P154DRAFT_527856 [Amniculicola lignicola CBS 123094]|uniref:Uncharacterized protein n=1 Tax=Amniculicola lignicola CBS 123094 TaxID=1392246 RepID=A0A6A5VUW6_9PLEO|nr:hypothetical protein P154DRAFT_527856 [Amniculicola lignicola CBS 123094]